MYGQFYRGKIKRQIHLTLGFVYKVIKKVKILLYSTGFSFGNQKSLMVQQSYRSRKLEVSVNLGRTHFLCSCQTCLIVLQNNGEKALFARKSYLTWFFSCEQLFIGNYETNATLHAQIDECCHLGPDRAVLDKRNREKIYAWFLVAKILKLM